MSTTRNRVEIHLDNGNNTYACIASKAILESLQEGGKKPVAVIVCIVEPKQFQIGFDIAAKENGATFSAMTACLKEAIVAFIEKLNK